MAIRQARPHPRPHPFSSKGGEEMKLYGAIDLHSTNNVTVLIDEQDEVVYQQRLPNDLTAVKNRNKYLAWAFVISGQ